MKPLIWLLFILGGAVGLSLVFGSNDGYILLVQPPYRIEFSLNLLVIVLVIGFASLHGMLRLIQYTLHLPENVRRFKESQRRKEAHAALTEGLHALVEGRYGKAETTAARALALGEDAGLSALVAARAAHRLKHYAQRDFYLAEAERLAPDAAIARLLTQTELLLDGRQYAQALQPLQTLEKIEPNYAPALKLLLKVHQRLGNWEQVLNVLTRLEKQNALEPVHFRQVQYHAHQQLLERHTGNREAIARLNDVADIFLCHNRDILIRTDDSVLRVVPEKVSVVAALAVVAPTRATRVAERTSESPKAAPLTTVHARLSR